jgi:hypothetical protein
LKLVGRAVVGVSRFCREKSIQHCKVNFPAKL